MHFYRFVDCNIFFVFRKLRVKDFRFFSIVYFTLACFSHISGQNQITFPYTGKIQRWYVPSCVQRVRIEVWGAQGGNSVNCSNAGMVVQPDGGLGGYASGELNVVNGQLLYIVVGGQGNVGRNGYPDGGYNGGGDGGMYAAGGGGATDIRTILHDLDSRLIVGGGGGGGNTGCPDAGTGGNGGGLLGQNGIALDDFGPGGYGGSQIAGGLKGNDIGEPQAEDGTWGQGGNAGLGVNQFHISGGGGGWYGGGSAYAAGGGGGSSNIWGVQNGSTVEGLQVGNGLVRITLLENEQCPACAFNCLSNINVSMPINECYMAIFADQVLAKVNDECSTFGYNLKITYPFGTAKLNGYDVDRSHLGLNLVYSVSDASGQNTCWATLRVEDKAAPVTGCSGTRIVSCYQLAKLLDIKTQVVDNCSEKNKATIVKMVFDDFGCDDSRGLGRITRTIVASDAWGNSSTCSDTLFISRDSLEETMAPDLISLNCKVTCKTVNVAATPNLPDYEEITFSKDPKNKYYPTPELLFSLQQQDTFNSTEPCLPSYLNVVPFIYDSVLVWDEGEYIKLWQKVNQYGPQGPYCKIGVRYLDQLLPICSDGTGFKIRREWLIIDWCTNRERIIIQYIEVEDKTGPALFLPNGGLDLRDDRLYYLSSVDPHSCYTTVALKALITIDCSPTIVQSFISHYSDPENPAKIIQQRGTLPGSIKLPANEGVYGVRCHDIDVTLADGCGNFTNPVIEVCVIDDQRPEVLAHEATRVTVDPATCWSRIYAVDLDNGSRDNCCNVLHFAIARMDSITAARKYVYDAIIAQCGVADYWDSKEYYDFYIEDYISSYIFKDYLDLTACEEYQIVLRVWEACGIPRFDPHIWPCSEHQWFLYNAGYPRSHYRADHNLNFGFSQNANYTKFTAPKDCNWRYPLVFCDPLLKDWFALSGLDDFNPYYIGAGAAELCNFSFYWPRLGNVAGSFDGDPVAPGNTCSRMLWQDAMVMVTVDDKTPPIAQDPKDLFWYCDNVAASENNSYEYAQYACQDITPTTTIQIPINPYVDEFTVGGIKYKANDNIADFTCRDKNQAPYNEIECSVENDGLLDDVMDPTGKAFGWYGCSIYGIPHDVEHGTLDPCPVVYPGGDRIGINDIEIEGASSNVWIPIYCHTWLCLDRTDPAGKIDPKTAFYKPVLRSGSPGAAVSSTEFIVWDNCTIGTATTKDEQFVDNCGNGWLKRTWTIKDKCGLEVTVDQKIITRHRSDFEVMFPEDVTVYCDSDSSLSPALTGRPMVMDDECELVGQNYIDTRYDIVPDACYKIIRTWKVLDWCKYDPNQHDRYPEVIVDDRAVADTLNRFCVYRKLKDDGDGYMIYTQVIKVIDTTAPLMAVCKNDTVCILDGYKGVEPLCTVPSYTSPDFNASDNCTQRSDLSFRWELDIAADGKDILKSGPNQKNFHSTSLPKGTHKLFVIVEDNCGNEDTTSCLITVRDCKRPTPYCYNGIATVVMPSTGSVRIWAKDLDAGSFDNCTSRSNLKFSFGNDSSISKVDFTCKDIPRGRSATIPVDIYVWDAAGLTDFCKTYILLQDGIDNSCPDSLTSTKNPNQRLRQTIGQGVPSTLPNEPHTNALFAQDDYLLMQNFPNPFTASTWIQFKMSRSSDYHLVISDISGRVIYTNKGNGQKGLNQVLIHRQHLNHAGIYYYSLSTMGYTATKKMIIIH